MNVKTMALIVPSLRHREAACGGQHFNVALIELMGRFGVNCFTLLEGYREAERFDAHGLFFAGYQVRFDDPTRAIVERAVLERAHVEVSAEFAIDARQNITIESCRDARRIVIRKLERL